MFMLESARSSTDEGELHIGSKMMIAIDSGSEVHAIPFKLVKQYIEEMKSETSLLLRGAGQERLQYHGRLRISLKVGQTIVTSDFEVAEVRRPIFSVGVLEEHGWRVILDSTSKTIERGQVQLNLTKRGRLYLLPAEVLKAMRITGAPAETTMMPVEEHVHPSAPAASAEDDVKLPRETRMPTEANPAESDSTR